MAINRFQLVSRHNPVLTEADLDSPLSVGNGEFAFTADITGLQTLYGEYKENHVPLCTMSQWGWHTTPVMIEKSPDGDVKDGDGKPAWEPCFYSTEDVLLTEYDFAGRTVSYAVEKKTGNEEVYDWLRQNPHRQNLGRLAFLYKGKEIKAGDLTDIHQELKLYEGIIESRFCLHGRRCLVRTACHGSRAVLGVSVESEALMDGSLEIYLIFPYGSPDITAADFNHPDRHSSKIIKQAGGNLLIQRKLDRDGYYAGINTEGKVRFTQPAPHEFILTVSGSHMVFTLAFSKDIPEIPNAAAVFESSRNTWKNFWEKGGMVDLHKSKDPRAMELERRIVLSQYLSAIQSCGSMPPQETGLTCNSWYGKFHLEMYLWHCGYLPLWNRTELLERSLPWYRKNLEAARKNAAKNGYAGARWPKMVAFDAVDSPSTIATLLIWQQPHIIYMLELACKSKKEDRDFMEEYWEVVKETAEFMADYAVWNPVTGKYDLCSPIIPAQEEHDPRITVNPAFEVEYWRFALEIASYWAKRLGKDGAKWAFVSEHMAELPVKDGLYLAHENCPDTFEAFDRDHPSMLGAYGLIPGNRVSKAFMDKTLKKVLECWDFSTMWGWDFAMMAMTAVRLGDADTAINILLKASPKNCYVASGNNFQKLRTDLPLYLPGNGSLLLAVPIMIAGYPGCPEELPGFPKDGMWTVEYESISAFPY